MSGWEDLDAELDAWRRSGRTADLWWRDDDAHTTGAALERLLALQRRTGVPLALAVVPARAESALADALADTGIRIVQHGYSHEDTAPPGGKKTELGLHRPLAMTVADLAAGRERLGRLFGSAVRAVLVPPWNRIAPQLVPMLPEIGYRGLSRYGPRRRREPVRGLAEVNTHVDIVDWKHDAAARGRLAGERRFAGESAALALLVGHLAARRGGEADAEEPTGLLTHHLAHDAQAWRFVEALLERTRNDPRVRWRDPAELFPS